MAKKEKERRERNNKRRRAILEIKSASFVVNNSVTQKNGLSSVQSKMQFLSKRASFRLCLHDEKEK